MGRTRKREPKRMWNYDVWSPPVRPDVYELREGGFVARARVISRVGRSGETSLVFEKGTQLHEVLAWQAAQKDKIRAGSPTAGQRKPSYNEYWPRLLARRSAMAERGKSAS